MEYKEMLVRANQMYEEAKAILSNPEATAEEKEKVQKLIEGANDLRARAMQLKEVKEKGQQMAAVLEAEQGANEQPVSDREFKSWAEFLQAAHAAKHPQRVGPPDPRLVWFRDEPIDAKETKQMVEAIGAAGGFLVPTEFLAQLQVAVAENAIVRPRATVIRMARRSIQIPVLDQTATGVVGAPAWFGGMVAAWGKEALEKVLEHIEWRQIELVAHKLYLYTCASDELVEDAAISLSDFLSGPMGMAGCIAFMEDFAFLNGSGAGQPLGVVTAVNTPTIVVARSVAGQINIVDLANMMQSFLPSGKGVWVVSQSAMSSMIQLAGPGGNPAYWWMPTGVGGVPGTLLGLPVFWSEKMAALGNQGDILLADFSFYLVGDRRATTVESTKFDRWAYDETSWRAVHRVEGQPWMSAPITYQDQATTVSPFVILGGVGGS